MGDQYLLAKSAPRQIHWRIPLERERDQAGAASTMHANPIDAAALERYFQERAQHDLFSGVAVIT